MIEDLEKCSEKLTMDMLVPDLTSMIAIVMSYLAKSIDMNELESRLASLSSVDESSLEKLIEEAKEIVAGSSVINIKTRVIDPKQSIIELEGFIKNLVTRTPLLKREDVALQMSFVGNHMLDEILFCAVNSGISVDSIKELVRNKIKMFSEDLINTIWGMIVGETDANRLMPPVVIDPSIMNQDFLKFEDIERSKEKIVDYIVELKPKLIVSMFNNNVYQYPTTAPGSLRIISSVGDDVLSSISDRDVMLGNSISRLACAWQEVLFKDMVAVADLIGISKEGLLLNGPNFQEARKLVPADKKKILPLVFLELKRVVHVIDSIIAGEKPVEKNLWQYKLGLEVMLPDIVEEIKKKNELKLQKELCKFLIERGIYAVGTKFGRSQTDLLTVDDELSYIIEAKVYNTDDTLNENSLIGNIAQLQSYMDQYPQECKGVIAIYNMTGWLIETPRRWIRQKYWILPINLQAQPPSGRENTVIVEESGDEKLIRAIINKKVKRARRKKG